MAKTNIGGSALIEGLLMIGPQSAAIAIRKPDGAILIDKRSLPIKSKLTAVPILRGVISFFLQMVISTKALMFSAEFVEVRMEGDSKESFIDKFLAKVFKEKVKEALIYMSLFSH